MIFVPLRVSGPLCLFAMICSGAFGAEPDPVEALEKAATEWVKARAEVGRLETEWSTQQRLLESMVSGYDERALALEEKRDFLQAKTAKDREELATLSAANKASAAALQATEGRLKAMTARLLQLRPLLPPRLSEALDLSYRSLAGGDLSLGERMQLTVTVLNRCMQFNRGISCEEEVLKMDDGKNPQLLDVIYWGLGFGYALDRAADKAWFGSPGPAGWQWQPLSDGAGPVARLIAIYRGNGEPRFVEVPATLNSHSGESPRK